MTRLAAVLATLVVLPACGGCPVGTARCEGNVAWTCVDDGEGGGRWSETDCSSTSMYPNSTCTVGTDDAGAEVAVCGTTTPCDRDTFQSYCNDAGRGVNCLVSDMEGIWDCPAWTTPAECYLNEGGGPQMATCLIE